MASSGAVPSIDATLGATFIGVVVAAVLYGVTCLQTWHYYHTYGSDTWRLKGLVLTVWVCDTVHQVLISHTVYTYLVTHYADPQYLGMLVWSLLVEVLFNGFTAFVVQCFFTIRIYHLSHKNIMLTGLVAALVLAQFCVTLVYVGKSLPMKTYEQLDTLKGLSMAVNATTAASDVVIAMSLVSMLHLSRTGFKRSDSVINKLILYTVNTGLLTSIDAICSLASIAALPNTFIYICFFFALGRLYANSLLATLNARKSIRQKVSPDDMSLSGLQSIPRTVDVPGLKKPTNNIAIQIDTTREFTRDRDAGSTKDLESAMDSKQDHQSL